MELTVESRLTIRPLRRPFDSAAPRARNFTCSSSISAMSADVLTLPMSNPTRYLSFFAKPAPGLPLSRFRSRGAAGVGVQHHLLRVLQIDRVDAAVASLPLREILDDHAVLPGEVARAEMNRYRLRIVGAGNAGHHRAKVFRIGEICFTDAIGRAGAHQIDVLHEFLIGLHALAAFFAWHALRQAGNNWKLQIFAQRAVKNHAVRIDEGKFGAIAEKSDWCAFGQLHADAIGKNALYGGGFNPGNFFKRTAPDIQRNAQDAAAAVAHELLQHRFAADDVVAGDLNLIGLDEQHLLAIEQKAAGRPCRGCARDSDHAIKQNAAIERPAAAAEFLAADFDGLLAPQIAWLFIAQQLGPVCVGVRCRGAARYGLHAVPMTTSCSSSTWNAERTRSRTLAIRASMSLALALPALTKKLAWRSLTRASPTLKPLRPRSSIMRSADAPGGFLKMQPAPFWPSGLLGRHPSLPVRIPC